MVASLGEHEIIAEPPAQASLFGSASLVRGTSWQTTSASVSGGTLTFASTSDSSYRGIAGIQLVGDTAAVPEPSTFAFLGGVMGMGVVAYRRKKKQDA